jgi:Cys-rich four helix bundle protein (predicted Tat secretion target)
MNRRDVILGAGAVLAAAAARADKPKPAAPAKDPHAGHAMGSPLVDAAADCVKKGRVCLAHCLGLLAAGDATMGSCAKSVNDMVAFAEALLAVAGAGSKHAAALGKLTADVARECEAECKKHADKHEACKACMECCGRLVAEAAKS